LGTFVVGLVAGSQFGASLLSRFWAGRRADGKGAKHAMVTGLLVAVTAGAVYVASVALGEGHANLSAAIVLAGRGVLGIAESLIITGATAAPLNTMFFVSMFAVLAAAGVAIRLSESRKPAVVCTAAFADAA
jgi:hypothetical protein